MPWNVGFQLISKIQTHEIRLHSYFYGFSPSNVTYLFIKISIKVRIVKFQLSFLCIQNLRTTALDY
jgi:hypothetical protein